MSRPSQPAIARRRELSHLLEAGRNVSTARLADRLGVSEMTIRRDLESLARNGQAIRCYGGAVAAGRVILEFEFDQRHRCQLEPKRRIGEAAAAAVQKGWTVFLDTGTTTLEVARALGARALPCTVVTSSLVVASQLWAQPQVELVLLGGRVRKGSPDLAGSGAEMMLDRLTADVAFLGADGIDAARGSFATDVECARVGERMAANARRCVVAADSTKLGRSGKARVLTVEQIDELITDRDAPPACVAALRRRGVKVTKV